MIFVLLLGCLAVVSNVEGKGDGAPASTCSSMMPGHGTKQTSTVPYKITFKNGSGITTKTVNSDALIEINLEKNNSGTPDFKGFLLQALETSSGKSQGEFSSIDSTSSKYLTCFSNSKGAITHKAATGKSSIMATWKAPKFYGSSKKKVKFYYTIAETRDKYWLKQMSQIEVMVNPLAKYAPETEIYDTCGDSNGCYGFSGANCIKDKNCKALVTYKQLKADKKFEFTLFGEISKGKYLSFALSSDKLMGGDLVISCRNPLTGSIAGKAGWTDGHKYSDDSIEGLTNILTSSKFINGYLSCTFKLDEVIKFKKSSKDMEINLATTSKYLLYAIGELNGTNLKKHTARGSSGSSLDLKSIKPGNSGVTVQIHGICVVFAWIVAKFI